MTIEKAINLLSQMFFMRLDEEEHEALALAIDILNKNVLSKEWIVEYNGNGWNDYWDFTCPSCKKKYERADNVLQDASFCPNCGARIKGVEDE